MFIDGHNCTLKIDIMFTINKKQIVLKYIQAATSFSAQCNLLLKWQPFTILHYFLTLYLINYRIQHHYIIICLACRFDPLHKVTHRWYYDALDCPTTLPLHFTSKIHLHIFIFLYLSLFIYILSPSLSIYMYIHIYIYI